ncbi:hypothetical protein AB0A70_21845 [Streptomyces morookaense]|uniref:hypothetical protein n=1 Tax=Streptomyces morookaense TaxID=1970 RepID=UPI0033FCB973
MNDPKLTDDARDMMVRMARLGPLYDSELPMCALDLDAAIDTGRLGLITGDDKGILVAVEDIVDGVDKVDTEADVRESIHRLHAHGVMLVEFHGDVPMLRIVARKPEKPGEPWIFRGSPENTSRDRLTPTP